MDSKRIIYGILIVCCVAVAAVWGADRKYYEFPDTTEILDTDRILVFQNRSSHNLTGAGLKAAMGGSHTHTAFGNISAAKITADSITVNQGSEAQAIQLMEALASGSNSVIIKPSDALAADHTLLITDSGLEFDGVVVATINDITAVTLLHNQMQGLNDGDYKHLTGAEKTGVDGLLDGIDATEVTYGTGTVSTILGLLTPAPPLPLSAQTLSISGMYTARESGTGTVRTSQVINTTTPIIAVSSAFGDGNSGTLTALIDGSASGSRALTTGSDVGTFGSLVIDTDADTYAGQSGKSGFWWQLTSHLVPSPAVAVKTAHTAQLSHTGTGNSGTITWYSDDAITPSISTPVVSGVTHTSGKHVSGVECLTTVDTIQTSATATNAVHSFYNNSQIIRFSGSQVSTLNVALPGTAPADGATVASGTQNVSVLTGYTAAAQITGTAYNSAGGTGTATLTSNVRIDTVSNESGRKTTGDDDTIPYGGTYDSTQPLTATAYLSELQMINGVYQYPPATNYSTNLPAGPNYSTGLGAGVRWVTFAFTGFSGTGRTFSITGSSNFGSTAVIAGLQMYARVDGASPTAGWVDLNAAYPGVGNPTNNGDAALAPGSTATSRILTFGSTVRTGTLYLRIGLPSGSTKSFTGAS